MRAKLAEELKLAEMELRDAQADEIEVEAVLELSTGRFTECIERLESRVHRTETAIATGSIPRGSEVFEWELSNRNNLLVFQQNATESCPKRKFGSATGNRTRVLRLRISRPNP